MYLPFGSYDDLNAVTSISETYYPPPVKLVLLEVQVFLFFSPQRGWFSFASPTFLFV